MSNLRIAVAQLHIEPQAEARNLQKITTYIRRAASLGADLIAFSEGMSAAYVFKGMEDAEASVTTVPGPFMDSICALAKELRIWVAIGVLERANPGIYNDALLVSAEGKIHHVYRKTFFIRSDKIWMRHGGISFEPAQTPFGQLGLIICADMRIPEPARCSALSGAQVLLNLSNWGGPDQYEIHTPARAIENRCWIISADKVGSEPGIRYPGHSQIIDPQGRVVAEAGGTDEEILIADIDLAASGPSPVGERLAGRRPELYRPLCDPAAYHPRPLANPQAEDAVPARYVAACQVVSGNVDAALEVCEEAYRLDEAELMVLPELCTVGDARDAQELRRCAAQAGEALEKFRAFSRKHRVVMVLGLPTAADAGGKPANAAWILEDGEVIGVYHKTHLGQCEAELFDQGSDIRIYQTKIGNLGVLLGQEGYLPEIPRLLALQGADILAWPCRWESQRLSDVFPLERALENQVYVVAASPAEKGVGSSQVVSPRSYPVPAHRVAIGPGRVGFTGQLIIPATARSKLVSRNTDVLAHRKPESYGVLLAQPSRL